MHAVKYAVEIVRREYDISLANGDDLIHKL